MKILALILTKCLFFSVLVRAVTPFVHLRSEIDGHVVNGTGTVVADNCKGNRFNKLYLCDWYILTAAHVASGSNLIIVLDSSESSSPQKYINISNEPFIKDIINDIKFIKIKKESFKIKENDEEPSSYLIYPAFTYFDEDKKFLGRLNNENPQLNASTISTEFSAPFQVLSVGGILDVVFGGKLFTIIPSFVKSAPVPFHENCNQRIFYTGFSDRLTAQCSVVDGMSGSTVFSHVSTEPGLSNVYTIFGLVTQYDEDYKQSYFASMQAINKLFLNFKSHKNKQSSNSFQDNIEIKFLSPFGTFRHSASGVSEIPVDNRLSSCGGSGVCDSGDDDSGDGDSNFESKVFGSGLWMSAANTRSEEVLHQVIGLKQSGNESSKENSTDYYFLANFYSWSLIADLNQNDHDKSKEGLIAGSDLSEILKNRLNSTKSLLQQSKVNDSELKWITNSCKIKLNSDGSAKVHLDLVEGIGSENSSGEVIEFTLSKEGLLINPDKTGESVFKQRFVVSSRKSDAKSLSENLQQSISNQYNVNVSTLYFYDLNEVPVSPINKIYAGKDPWFSLRNSLDSGVNPIFLDTVKC